MTPREWNLRIKGARHRRLDALEDMRLQAVMMASLTNGKGIQKITKRLDKERKLIDQSSTSAEYDEKKQKDFDKRVRAVQRRAMQKWLDEKKNR